MPQATLTAHQLRDILQRWESLTVPAEIRSATRTQLCGTIAIAALIDGKLDTPFDVLVSDLSPGGLGFIHAQPLPVSREFAIASVDEKHESPINFRIAYCAEMDDGRYRIGAKFTNISANRKQLNDDLDSDPLFRSIFG
jgi:hypothetical protein